MGVFLGKITRAIKLENGDTSLEKLGCECISACGRIEAVNMEKF